jgi:UDP-N-acetylmuramate--alanine ligase
MLGRHNVLNSLSAVVLGIELGIPFEDIASSLASFQGVDRRFSIRGEVGGILVVDDYAHHPTEIAATLSAARQGYPQRRLWAVLQPHRYTRVQALFTEFGRAFFAADEVLVTDIYGAGEGTIPGIGADTLAEGINRLSNKKALATGDLDATLEHLSGRLEPGDLVLMLGAGSITTLSGRLLERLRQR